MSVNMVNCANSGSIKHGSYLLPYLLSSIIIHKFWSEFKIWETWEWCRQNNNVGDLHPITMINRQLSMKKQKMALEEPKSPPQKLQRHSGAKQNKQTKNKLRITTQKEKNTSFCLHHLIPQVGTAQCQEGSSQLTRVPLTRKRRAGWVTSFPCLLEGPTSVSSHPETKRADMYRGTRKKCRNYS